ncbi:LuxR C-terminal-related transcriptional regulator [Hymenobacter sp. BT175]|uniref:response regulator transcription factor n=1 Tax=Hymenobacter translucens TaxID=2886507 RepID=UPI001D0E9CDB|nr:LuxR C-terminal-related transcriptional regulator [Hymenobacter translucens]MCC2546805.1 LuxR C-terminal-related transcriptional regulator [Hymenobacter translucens]
MTDEELITQKVAEVAATADLYPGVVIVLNIHTSSVEYMSKRGLLLLRTSMAELRAMGPDYHVRFFNQEEAQDYVPLLFGIMEKNDFETVISFFQQVRTTEGPEWSWYLSTIKLLAQDTQGQPLLFICFASPIDPSSHVTAKVQRLLDENNFLRTNHHKYALLTRRECEVLQLLALGKSSQEIALMLSVSAQTAETHRRNIRHKLELHSTFDLGMYARAFNLI